MVAGEPHYLGHRRRLRERFSKVGLDAFADYEVVELLLTLAIPRADVKQTAKDEAISDWCARVSAATGATWRYIRVNQPVFDARPYKDLADVIGCAENA